MNRPDNTAECAAGLVPGKRYGFDLLHTGGEFAGTERMEYGVLEETCVCAGEHFVILDGKRGFKLDLVSRIVGPMEENS